MRQNKIYIFDMDNTLTDPKRPIDLQFSKFLTEFLSNNTCYLVTGGTYERICNQLDPSVRYRFDLIFPVLGCETWMQDLCLMRRLYDFPDKLMKDLKKVSPYIYDRGSLINFAMCDAEDFAAREYYLQHNDSLRDRQVLIEKMKGKYPELDFRIGGQVSIDITPHGWDKSQILNQIKPGQIVFFGDKCKPGGNDHELAVAVTEADGQVFEVNNYKDTWMILSEGIEN